MSIFEFQSENPRLFSMGNQAPSVLDSCSDEEAAFGDKEDGDWLSRLLVEAGGNTDDDSGDVVFVSELFPKIRSDSVKALAKAVVDDEGDDDCMVLDGDPDNPVVAVNDKADGGDSDELEIVGEKGEVACRDFPHSRHLCAKYLFASTAHEVHCGLCHCYVCDTLAPCLHWGTGASSTEHCHASDKDEYWRAERKRAKKSYKPSAVQSTTTTSTRPGCHPSQPNSLPQHQGVKRVAIRPCVLSSAFGLPNAMNRERSQVPRYHAPEYNPQSMLAPVRSHPRSTNTVSPKVTLMNTLMNKHHHVGVQNPLSSYHPVFKRNGLSGPFTNNNHAHGSQLSRDPPLNRHPAFQAPVTNGRHDANQLMYGSPAAGLPSRYLPSEAQITSQPILSRRNRTYIPHQSQMPSQPSVSGSSLGSPPLQPYQCTEPSVGYVTKSTVPQPYIAYAPDNHAPYQTVGHWQLDAGNTLPDQLHSRSTISAQLQKQNNPTSMFTCVQNDVQHQYHTQSGIGSNPADIVLFRDSFVGHGNMQSHAANGALAGTSQAQTIQHDWPSMTTPLGVDNPPQQNAEVAAYSSTIDVADYQFPESREPDSFQLQFLGNSMFGNQSVIGAVEAAASPNVYSSETAFADTD
ncbi:uncharacterized protein LOC125222735 isoform X2 [Salvia hispanica]|uniref:uncharacterized protein LOC125222735 isoform X2 n=1 Tax=Salvia hispanica TaxID=49212 RepID=UPI002008F666|nr:uncharacterized protein LOC125222735 isoform X2 [Salvia hispanica]